MAYIQPITFPFKGDAVKLIVRVNSFDTQVDTTSLSWSLQTAEGFECLSGIYNMTIDEFTDWGQDNSYLDILVANSIPVIIV
jgi:hypothetical protein